MALNPYTLNHLYQNGILDYVPQDLGMVFPVMQNSNPYLNMAQQGMLYQSHGTGVDSFHSNYTPAYTPEYPQNVNMTNSISSNIAAQNGIISGTGSYGYQGNNTINNGIPVIGSKSNTNFSTMYNGYGVGTQNNTGFASMMGENGVIGSKTNAGGANIYGGFADTQMNINNGIGQTMSVISQTPKSVLGVLAGVIGITGIALALKRGKKPAKVQGNSFWSNLNPMKYLKK